MPSLLGVGVFDGGRTESRTLAYVDPYGTWLHWIETGSLPPEHTLSG
jgi:hypothetical protein